MTAGGARLVIAGTNSGVGKTSLAVGLARCLTRRGLRVQTFKVGPDFLDPTYLALASGRTCYNLDGWMTSRQHVEALFARAAADVDVALIEGVMGLFDGASPSTIEGSTAEIARWLDAPVLLVANAHGAARSLAATVQGFANFEPGVRVAGVIANQGGSERHRNWLAESLAGVGVPLVGMVPRDALPRLPSRHLGLVTADGTILTPTILDQLADACEKHVDVAAVVAVARSEERTVVGLVPRPTLQTRPALQTTRVRVGIARDAAFHFYYPDNLEMLEGQGVEWAPFSPLADASLPEDLDGLYFGGGYPEVFAGRLAANATLLAEIGSFAASGRCVYAECGGLMYLGRSVTTIDGVRHALAGVLPIHTAMLPKLKVLGYTEVAWAADSLWGGPGQVVRGHEFHFSEITADESASAGWQPAYSVRRRGAATEGGGFLKGNVQAGYVHLHWASQPEAMRHFLTRCKERS
jgi:cobyrinic acid a,c-diamide synthase